jgi:hypothetical protein
MDMGPRTLIAVSDAYRTSSQEGLPVTPPDPSPGTCGFKVVEGWTRYGVDETGGVWYRRSEKDTRWSPLKPRLKPKTGYLSVCLWNSPKKRFVSVHVLILESFVGQRPDGHAACHCDGNRLNNSVQNLRWDTYENNSADMDRHGTKIVGEKVPTSRFTPHEVRAIRLMVASGESRRSVARRLGVNMSSICRIAKGESWRHLS